MVIHINTFFLVFTIDMTVTKIEEKLQVATTGKAVRIHYLLPLLEQLVIVGILPLVLAHKR